MRLHFISFFTEGPPNDEADDLREAKKILQQAIAPHVDSTTFYSPSIVRGTPSWGPTLLRSFNHCHYKNKGTEKIGFLRWKPYIILDAMNRSEEGDIIYYRDCNVIKYPAILNGVHDTRSTVSELLQHDDIFVPAENSLLLPQHVKREVITAMLPLGLTEDDPRIQKRPLLNASIIIVRNTVKTRYLMKEWFDWCLDDHLLQSSFDETLQTDAFRWNTQEQAILNMLLLQYGYVPSYIMHDRDFRLGYMTPLRQVEGFVFSARQSHLAAWYWAVALFVVLVWWYRRKVSSHR